MKSQYWCSSCVFCILSTLQLFHNFFLYIISDIISVPDAQVSRIRGCLWGGTREQNGLYVSNTPRSTNTKFCTLQVKNELYCEVHPMITSRVIDSKGLTMAIKFFVLFFLIRRQTGKCVARQFLFGMNPNVLAGIQIYVFLQMTSNFESEQMNVSIADILTQNISHPFDFKLPYQSCKNYQFFVDGFSLV